MSSINYCDAHVLLYYKDSLNSEVLNLLISFVMYELNITTS
jgi:hypothetical protein